MKRLILLLFLGGFFSLLQAQTTGVKLVSKKGQNSYQDDYVSQAPAPFTSTYAYKASQLMSNPQPLGGGNRVISYTEIGSAGNLFTILDGAINRVASNNTLNSVVFIHRANPDSIAGSNVGQYTFDVSKDGGATWTTDNGLVNPQGNNIDQAGRYPNAVIYNPSGNTNPDNAYMAYLGAWLPFSVGAADWEGYFHGVARLDADPLTYTADTTNPNGGEVSIARGLCEGAPGVLWAVDYGFDGTEFNAILLYRGVWNPVTNDFDWSTYRKFTPTFDRAFDGTSQLTALNMAFDRTGQFGWIAFTGDITSGGENAMNPGFYRTVDGGATWTGPIVVDLSGFDNVVANLADPLTEFPQTGFDLDIVVDKNGNPHVLTVVGSGSDYAIQTGGASRIAMYDITRVPGATPGCEWTAIMLDSVSTFRGNITPEVTEDNRPQASISPDGRYVMFGWSDSDPTATGGDNVEPDIITRSIDVDAGLASALENQTQGTTFASAALFPSFAPTSLVSGNTITVPVVIGRLNPQTFSDADPAFFYYVNGIDYDVTADYTDDVYAPAITLTGANPMTLTQGNAYSEPGYSATDNVDGNVTGSVVVTGTVNENVPGAYQLVYSVTDAAGNSTCNVIRTVNVVASPDNTPPTITLVGADTITLDICDYFVDPGATATDDVDGNITNNITTSGTVANGSPGNPGTPGFYTVTYTVTDGAGNSASINRVFELQDLAPTISLVGDATITIEVCEAFNDPGATGYDNCIGSVSVTTTGTVNNQSPGTYTITYQATDGTNNATVTRTVIVNPDQSAPIITLGGSNPVYVYLNDPYNDVLPTATDCSGIESITSDAGTTVNVTARGSYTVTYTVVDSNGNGATATRTVIVGTEPDAAFTFTKSGLTVSFTDASLYNPTSWTWSYGNGNMNAQRNPTYTYPNGGSYEVCLEAKNVFNNPPFNKPVDSTCQQIDVTVGIGEEILERAFTVYPNPTTGEVTLDVKDLNFDRMNVTVLNMLGEVVIAENHSNVLAQSKYQLNLSNFAKGMYLVRINTEQGVVTKRITLQPAN